MVQIPLEQEKYHRIVLRLRDGRISLPMLWHFLHQAHRHFQQESTIITGSLSLMAQRCLSIVVLTIICQQELFFLLRSKLFTITTIVVFSPSLQELQMTQTYQIQFPTIQAILAVRRFKLSRSFLVFSLIIQL